MSGKAKIVVVDDDATMREALRETLAGEGYAVLAVDNAIQAIAELEKQEADLVLADLTLPRVSGLELLDSIRRQWPGLEVIVITGQGSIETGDVGDEVFNHGQPLEGDRIGRGHRS